MIMYTKKNTLNFQELSVKRMLSIVLLLFIFAQVSYGYGRLAHEFLTGEGIDAYLAWVNQDNDGRVGEVVATHRDEIVLGSWQEDVPPERVLDHFWDPKTGEGWLPLIGKSALERAQELYADALSAYMNEVYGGGRRWRIPLPWPSDSSCRGYGRTGTHFG